MNYSVGKIMISPKFGKGTFVTEDKKTVTVLFPEGEKRLMKLYAPLTNEDNTRCYENQHRIKKGKSTGRKKRERDAIEISKFNNLPNVEKIKQQILWINGAIYGDVNGATMQLFIETVNPIINSAMENDNIFVIDVINTIKRTYKCSDKQAFIVANFADKNQLKG